MYEILRGDNKNLIHNEEGNVLVKDTETDDCFWLPQGFIKYTNQNEPYVQDRGTLDDEEEEMLQAENNAHNQEKNKSVWSYTCTMALIAAIEARYDELHHLQKRKHIWETIHNDLVSQKIIFSAANCQRKWQNLLRTYKATKDNQKMSGRGPTRFLFFNRLDELLGDKPSNSSPHSVDVATLQNTEEETCPEASISETSSTSTDIPNRRKRRTGSDMYFKLKADYYKNKEEINKRNSAHFQKYLDEKLSLARKKIELEERKQKLLDQLLNKL